MDVSMTNRSRKSDVTEGLLRAAAEAEMATHRLALYLGTTDDRVRDDPGAAMRAVLSKLPVRGPLRRERDRIVIEAVRTLCRDLPKGSSERAGILARLSEVSRQASQDNWPADTWEGGEQ